MDIFLDDTDRREFVYLLGDVVERFGIRCWNYCLMPNHYHATLQPREANLSEAIRNLNGVYAQWWNHRHGRVGHVFQGRFKAQIVDHDQYMLVLSRYVVMNPVRAGLVERPEDWSWSSYCATMDLRPCPSFLDPGSTLRLFGDGDEDRLRGRFANYVKTPYDTDPMDDRIRSKEDLLGGADFKAAVRRQAWPESDVRGESADGVNRSSKQIALGAAGGADPP